MSSDEVPLLPARPARHPRHALRGYDLGRHVHHRAGGLAGCLHPAVLALRFTLAAVALAAAFAGRYSTFPAVRRSMAAGAFAGLALFSGYFFQTAGLRYTSAPKSAFITSLSVVTVPLLAALVYRSVPRAAEGIGVVLATAGLALLTLPESGLGVGLGDLLTVVCALSFAAHIVIVGHYSAKCSFQVMSLTQICTAALIAGGSFWWAEHPRVHWTPRLLIAIVGYRTARHRSGIRGTDLGAEAPQSYQNRPDPGARTRVRVGDFVPGGGRKPIRERGFRRAIDPERDPARRTETALARAASILVEPSAALPYNCNQVKNRGRLTP